MWEVRARVYEAGDGRAIEQGCYCNISESECPVHSDQDAYAVEIIYYGQRSVILSTKSHMKMPIKREIYFYKELYYAVKKWSEKGELVDPILLRKGGRNNFRKFVKEEMDQVFDIEDWIAHELELAGM